MKKSVEACSLYTHEVADAVLARQRPADEMAMMMHTLELRSHVADLRLMMFEVLPDMEDSDLPLAVYGSVGELGIHSEHAVGQPNAAVDRCFRASAHNEAADGCFAEVLSCNTT